MLRELKIKNFKNITEETFLLNNLTIFTGLNSTGKSSVLQSILLLSHKYSLTANPNLDDYVSFFSNFVDVRNKYTEEKSIEITARCDKEYVYNYRINTENEPQHNIAALKQLPKELRGVLLNHINNNKNVKNDEISNLLKNKDFFENNLFTYEDNLYYLSANRLGPEDISLVDASKKVGKMGEYLIGFLETHKTQEVSPELVKFEGSNTLSYQVDMWLKEILDIDITANTERIDDKNAKLSFDIDGISKINPVNVGAGNSYLIKILILCLLCKKGNIVIIENPEIHLHPKAQARLGMFFSFLAENGVQVILETHSEHLINKIRYEVFKKHIKNENVNIYYKKSLKDNFINLQINEKGKFINSDKKEVAFPSGFFDSTLTELLEMS